MSLLPFFLDDFHTTRPSRLLDQQFGMGLDAEDLLMPFTIPQEINRLMKMPTFRYYRPWKCHNERKDGNSQIAVDKDKFEVNLDVQHFSPEEITVKVTGDNGITVEAKHEERQDEHGYISRHFIRKYVLPEGHDINRIESKLSSDGVLLITAPKTNTDAVESRQIEIQQTGIPSKSVEVKKTEDKNN